MKKIFLFVALIAIASVSAYSQTAKEFAQKAYQVWGDSKVDTAKTVKIEMAKIDDETSAESPMTFIIKDKKKRIEFTQENQKIIIIFDGKKYWAKTTKGVDEIPTDQAEYLMYQLEMPTALARPCQDLIADTLTYDFDGQDVSGEKTLKVVKLTQKSGFSIRYYFDAGTAVFNRFEYSQQLEKPSKDGSKELKFKFVVAELGRNKGTLGYRAKVGQIFVNDKKAGEFAVKSVVINEPMDDKLFEKPE